MNEEIKASVDSPEFREMIREYAMYYADHKPTSAIKAGQAYSALIAHINAWSDERCNEAINQLAASRAVLPVTDSQPELLVDRHAALRAAPASTDESSSAVLDEDALHDAVASSLCDLYYIAPENDRVVKKGDLTRAGTDGHCIEKVMDAIRPFFVATADSRDAARYRWLRRRNNCEAADLVARLWDEKMDAAIDAAMSAPPAPASTPTQQNQQEQS